MAAVVPTPNPDPADALGAAVELRRLAEDVERAGVDRALAAGWSWAKVAAALGVSRQAAHQKHAHRHRR